MSNTTTRLELDDLDVAGSATQASLNVVSRLTKDKADVQSEWETAIRLAQANGASLRDIAAVAGASPQTVSKICQS